MTAPRRWGPLLVTTSLAVGCVTSCSDDAESKRDAPMTIAEYCDATGSDDFERQDWLIENAVWFPEEIRDEATALADRLTSLDGAAPDDDQAAEMAQSSLAIASFTDDVCLSGAVPSTDADASVDGPSPTEG